jgi:hypothetical protein
MGTRKAIGRGAIPRLGNRLRGPIGQGRESLSWFGTCRCMFYLQEHAAMTVWRKHVQQAETLCEKVQIGSGSIYFVHRALDCITGICTERRRATESCCRALGPQKNKSQEIHEKVPSTTLGFCLFSQVPLLFDLTRVDKSWNLQLVVQDAAGAVKCVPIFFLKKRAFHRQQRGLSPTSSIFARHVVSRAGQKPPHARSKITRAGADAGARGEAARH